MTIEDRLEILEEELTRANYRNHCLLVVLVLCLGFAVVAWLFGPQVLLAQNAPNTPKEVRANRFVLEDAKGKIRAEVLMDGDDPKLQLLDAQGKSRVTLASGKAQSELTLFDETFKSNVWMVSGRETAALRMVVEKGNPVLMMTTNKGGGSLSIGDEKGTERVNLSADMNSASLDLSDEHGKTRAAISTIKEGQALALHDDKGEPRVYLACIKDNPSLAFLDEKGLLRTVLTSPQQWPGLQFFADDGSMINIISTDGKTQTSPAADLSREKAIKKNQRNAQKQLIMSAYRKLAVAKAGLDAMDNPNPVIVAEIKTMEEQIIAAWKALGCDEADLRAYRMDGK